MSELSWSLYNNPVLSDGNLYLHLSAQLTTTAARYTTLRLGGFGDGALEFADVDRATARDAAQNWLMKEVRFTTPGGGIAYKGFVAEVTVEYGYLTIRRRVGWIANRVIVRFRRRDPTRKKAQRRQRVTLEDTESQARYGIRTLRLDLTEEGVMKAAQATARGQLLLDKFKNFQSIARTNLPHPPRVRLALWGRWQTTGFQDVRLRFSKAKEIATIVQQALASCQFVDTSDLSRLAATGTLIRYNSDGMFRSAQSYIQDAVQYGDSASNRLLFQIWDDDVPVLQSAPTTVGVFSRSEDARVWGDGRTPVPAWSVRAGDYMLAEDWDERLDAASGVSEAVLIEQTSYDALTDTVELESADIEGVASALGKARRGRRVVVA